MIVSCHQPDYIPWLGFYYKVAHSDLFVYLDDVQFSKRAAHNFNVIKTPQGELRLKIPVNATRGDLIMEVTTKDELDWHKNQMKALEMNYKKAPFFDDIYPEFRDILTAKHANIAELNIAINQFILDGFHISVPIVRSSTMALKTVREERILDMCDYVGADEYLSGNGARAYQTESHFADRGLKLTYLDYKPIEYKQLWPKVGFLPCMSVLDYIFNCGFDWEQVERKVKEANEVLV